VNSDPWLHIIQQIQPLYFKWKDELENGPVIHTELSRRGREWCITLKEQSEYSDVDTLLWSNPGRLDERVEWALNQLSTWPNVRRMAHDMWFFKKRRDAEKFQTLYNLTWASE
jgi:hypothetical protein